MLVSVRTSEGRSDSAETASIFGADGHSLHHHVSVYSATQGVSYSIPDMPLEIETTLTKLPMAHYLLSEIMCQETHAAKQQSGLRMP